MRGNESHIYRERTFQHIARYCLRCYHRSAPALSGQATAPVKLPASHCPLLGLGPVHIKSGISPFAPPPPRGRLQSVPPILRMMCPDSMASCSKAPRGLFVLSWVTRIFTGLSISPGPSSRQRPDRYAFRAGRNLPDKEFRYLRTVIVTTAVYWRFCSVLSHLP